MSDCDEDEPQPMVAAMRLSSAGSAVSVRSSVSSNTGRTVGEQKNLAPLSERVFLRVLVCHACGIQSNAKNPILKGPLWADDQDHILYYVKWASGTPDNPRGHYCNLCFNNFDVSSWNSGYSSLDMLCLEMKDTDKNPTLQGEWNASLREYIVILSESGRVRFRQKEKDKLRAKLVNARRKFVDLMHSAATVTIQDYEGITVEQWLKENPGKTPEGEGVAITPAWVNGKLVDSICTAVQSQGRFRLQRREGDEVRTKESHYDQEQETREGQATNVAGALKRALFTDNLDNAKVKKMIAAMPHVGTNVEDKTTAHDEATDAEVETDSDNSDVEAPQSMLSTMRSRASVTPGKTSAVRSAAPAPSRRSSSAPVASTPKGTSRQVSSSARSTSGRSTAMPVAPAAAAAAPTPTTPTRPQQQKQQQKTLAQPAQEDPPRRRPT